MYIGQTKVMNNGYEAKITKIYDDGYVDCIFENDIERSHVSYSSFYHGKIGLKSNKQLHEEASIKDLRRQMKSGEFATCIAYRTNIDIDIRFDDGTEIYNVTKCSFMNGDFTNPNSDSRFSMKDVIIDMNCGMKAKCIEDRGCNGIDIMFEDETVVTTTRGNFRKGSVANPTLGYMYSLRVNHEPYIGQEKYMNCGYKCRIIKCDYVWDTTVEFEDGSQVEHIYKSSFDRGTVLHPKLGALWRDNDSIAQRLIFYWFKKFYPDTVYNIRPDWLRNNSTGKNFELDIYIPSIKVAIEFDGAVLGHFTYNRTNNKKFKLIQSSSHIHRIFVIRDDDVRIVTFNGSKYTNISLKYKDNSDRLPDLIEAINIILEDLKSVERAFFDYDLIAKLYNKEDFLCLLGVNQIREE